MIRDLLVSAPALEPVSTTEQKTHSRIDVASSGDTAYLTSLIKTARSKAESLSGMVFITQTWRLLLDGFPTEIILNRKPVQSITSIKYIDLDGVEQTLDPSTYELDNAGVVPRVVLAYGKSWPSTSPALTAVTVEYVAGFGDKGTDVPEDIRHAIKLLAGFYYENRESAAPGTQNEIPYGIEYLLLPYNVGV